jgi:hypothetical protein
MIVSKTRGGIAGLRDASLQYLATRREVRVLFARYMVEV